MGASLGKRLEIARMLVCSTAQITAKDRKMLQHAVQSIDDPGFGIPIVFVKANYGWWVYVPVEFEGEAIEPKLEDYRDTGYSSAFCDLLRFAAKNKCDWVMLDRDAGLVEGLEWNGAD